MSTTKVIPKWFYQLVFVVCSKLAQWAIKKGNLDIEQNQKANEGTERIKYASDKIKDTTVDPNNRSNNDIFDNSNFNN